MKRNIFIALLFAVLCVTKASAQSSLLATLNHEGTISTFYGANSLKEAYNAAAHGDVITLSSGTFVGMDINKAITLRGAGMFVDTLTHTEPTVISNSFTIDVTDTIVHRFTMEGIYSNQTISVGTLKNAMFLKCRFKDFRYKSSSDSKMQDLNFIHCRFADSFYLTNGAAAFTNCVVRSPFQSNDAQFSFVNCYVNDIYMGYSEYKNCVILELNNTPSISTSTYYNNLVIADYQNITFVNNTNVKLAENDARIQNFLTYSDTNDYILNDELKTLIKGIDGTEVSIHGGSLPYDPTPTNPQITKFNVAAKSTADGKLSVDIEVKNSGE